MLKQQTSLSLSPYMQLYDAFILKDNFLRQMHDLVDFAIERRNNLFFSMSVA